jgi:large subunit ribosomal protein L31
VKKEIHPKYYEISVTCSCGNKFKTNSTLNESLTIDVCDKCHPFYTGQHKIVDSTGRVERFHQRYKMPSTSKKQEEKKGE